MARKKLTGFNYERWREGMRLVGQRMESRAGRTFEQRPERPYDRPGMAGSMADFINAQVADVKYHDWASRVDRLRREGFLPWERKWLALNPIGTQAMRGLRRERVRMFESARINFASYNDYQRRISQWYKTQKWYFSDGTLNPFEMFKAFKRRKGYPDTPKPKKPRVRKDFKKSKRKSPRRQL